MAINLEWSEYVTSFDQAELTVTAGVVSNFNVDELGWLYSFHFTPDDEGVAATLAVHPAINQDQALNDNVASNTITFFYDVTQPTTTLTAVATSGLFAPEITNSQPILVDVVFSEAMFNFDAEDITIVGGVASITPENTNVLTQP